MDKLRGRVRAGSRFSGDAYIPARMVQRHARPHWCQGGRGSRSTAAQTRHPETPKTAESLLSPLPSPTVSFPGWEKGDKKERTLRPWGAQGSSCLSLECPAAPLGARGSGLPAAPPSGVQASDFNGSRPSQQHFGLRRDTERQETERGERRVKDEGERVERERTEENRKRNQRRNQTTRKFVRFPLSILFACLFLVSFFFFLKLFQWIGGQGAWGS